MKQSIVVSLVVGLFLVGFANAQVKPSPQSKPAVKDGEAKPKRQLTEKQKRAMAKLDLIIPEMKNPIEAEGGVRWCYLRKSKKEARRLLLPGDTILIHMTLWNHKTGKEITTTRRRPNRPHGLQKINVGVSVPGLDAVLPKLRVGDKVRIDVPSAMGFGEAGVPSVPANTDLLYALEIHKIDRHIDIPKTVAFDDEKSIKITDKTSYMILKDGKGPMAGEKGIVVYDFLATNDKGRIVDYSRLRKYAIMGGQASKCRPSYLQAFSPLARVGMEFLVKVDYRDVPATARPFLMSGANTLFMHMFVRWVVPFSPSTADMKTSESGLKYEIIEKGEGPAVKPTHHVTVHYAWWTADGNLIESSWARGVTNTLRQTKLPAGMVEALTLIRPGGRLRAVIPAKLAWGDSGRQGVPPGTDIVLELELYESAQLDKLPPKKKPTSKKTK